MSEAALYADGGPEDVRPVVRTGNAGNRPVWIFGIALLLGGALLFSALNSRRQDLATAELPAGPVGGLITAPPPLALAPIYPDIDRFAGLERLRVVPPPLVAVPTAPPPQAITRIIERPAQLSPDDLATLMQRQTAANIQPVLPPEQFASEPEVQSTGARVTAGRLANPSLTVPRGTIVAAVLETALDSSRPGAVRAIVSRDVRSFDGSHILIPRGSRLYGEYAADVIAGQRRAMINWQRLLRPDGVTVDLDSPSADPLGRAGVEGKYHSNFLARFGGAILQSVLDIGVALATGAVSDDAVIVNMPNSAQQVASAVQPQQAQPKVTVRQGTSVSVFVARDLDFSTVDR